MVSDFIQKNVTILRILLIITVISYYISSSLHASDVKVLLNVEGISPETSVSKVVSDMSSILSTIETGSLKKKSFKIVIDAGHGGHDPGAVGKNASEKDLTLKMAIKFGAMIEKKYPDVEVFQTRTTDVFIPLFRRIQYANEQNADLFISIHCNFISNSKTRGTETFVMGLHRADDNLEVAKRENASILLEQNYQSNYEGYDPNSAEGHIMMSMYQNAYLDKSIEFAADVEAQFAAHHLSKSRGVKQAGFAVLRRASMPAVLVEAGFLSNQIEEAYLMSDEGQLSVTEALLKAFETFYDNNMNSKSEVATSTTNSGKNDQTKTSAAASTKNSITDKQASVGEKSKDVVDTKTANTNRQENKTADFPKFKVQIAAFRNETADLDSAELKKIGKLSVAKYGDINKYLVGDFITRESAEIAREKLKNLGYKGAFLVAFTD